MLFQVPRIRSDYYYHISAFTVAKTEVAHIRILHRHRFLTLCTLELRNERHELACKCQYKHRKISVVPLCYVASDRSFLKAPSSLVLKAHGSNRRSEVTIGINYFSKTRENSPFKLRFKLRKSRVCGRVYYNNCKLKLSKSLTNCTQVALPCYVSQIIRKTPVGY